MADRMGVGWIGWLSGLLGGCREEWMTAGRIAWL